MTGNSVEQEIEDLLIETFGNSVGSVPRTKPTKYTSSLKAALADVERELIRQQSEESHCSMADLAKKLGIGRTTLWRKLNHPELR
jgi:DNA-binding NtrC family response regulator